LSLHWHVTILSDYEALQEPRVVCLRDLLWPLKKLKHLCIYFCRSEHEL
jgi:hypothetical protein